MCRRRRELRFPGLPRRGYRKPTCYDHRWFSLIKFYAVEIASTCIFVVFIAFEAFRAVSQLVR